MICTSQRGAAAISPLIILRNSLAMTLLGTSLTPRSDSSQGSEGIDDKARKLQVPQDGH